MSSEGTVDDELVVNRLRDILKEVDLDTCTERQLRERLENEFSISLKKKKDLVKKEIEDFLMVKSAEDALGRQMKPKKRPQSKDLSPDMQEFMGTKTSSWHDVVTAVWKHIRTNDLQNPNNRHEINLDERLSLIFQAPLTLSTLSTQLQPHILEEEVPQKKPRGSKKTGFMRPLRLSGQLRELLGIRVEEQVSRGDLSKKFWDYFRTYDLQDPSDKRWINSDDSLRSLLGTDRFQAFAIQRLCKPHILGYVGDQPKEQESEDQPTKVAQPLTASAQEEVVRDTTQDSNKADETQPNTKLDEAGPSTANGNSEQLEATLEPEGLVDEQVNQS